MSHIMVRNIGMQQRRSQSKCQARVITGYVMEITIEVSEDIPMKVGQVMWKQGSLRVALYGCTMVQFSHCKANYKVILQHRDSSQNIWHNRNVCVKRYGYANCSIF